MNSFNLTDALIKAFGETAFMVIFSLVLAVIFGGLVGLLLFVTSNPLFIKNRAVNQFIGAITNIIRSIPFVILLVLILSLTRMMGGITIGAKAVVLPLSVAAIAFYARLAEGSFSEVNKGVLEAAIASGTKPFSIILHILIPEALPQLLKNITVTAVSLIGYSAMAGIVGGGGIGDLAIRYGYQRFQTDIMLICVVILVIIVQIIQLLGDYAAARANKR